MEKQEEGEKSLTVFLQDISKAAYHPGYPIPSLGHGLL